MQPNDPPAPPNDSSPDQLPGDVPEPKPMDLPDPLIDQDRRAEAVPAKAILEHEVPGGRQAHDAYAALRVPASPIAPTTFTSRSSVTLSCSAERLSSVETRSNAFWKLLISERSE